MTVISSGQLSIYDMNDVYSSTTSPQNPIDGSLWYNTTEKKLYIYVASASQWIYSSAGLDIGGRNYLKNTSSFSDTTNWNLSMGTGVSGVLSVVSDGTYGAVLQATKTTDGGSWWVLGNTGLTLQSGKFTVGKNYTLSFWVKNDFPLYVNFLDGNGSNGVIGTNYTISTNATWTKIVYTFKATATGNTPELYIAKSNTTNGTVQITQVQLEDGVIGTSYGKAPEDVDTVISSIQTTLGNMANDNLIDYSERTDIKDKITEIIGYVISDSATSLPTDATLDAGSKGTFYQARRGAYLAGIDTSTGAYPTLVTQYNTLKSYLESMSPRPWDCSDANKNQNISVTKTDFRTNWINYYNAELNLDTATSSQLKSNVDSLQVGGRNFGLNSNFSVYTTNASIGWDNALNGTNAVTSWSLYNSGVPSPSVGYHAHLNTTKFSYPVLEMNDRNSTYGATLAHRWMGASQLLSGTSSAFALGLHTGDTFTLSMEVYSDTVGSLINVGIYHTQKSTATLTFGNTQTNLTSCQTANVWEKKTLTFTIDSDWDLTKDDYIYIYGYKSSMECTQWIKNVKLESGQKATTWNPSPEDQKTYTDTQASDGKNAWLKFSSTNNTLPSGTITWGNNQTTTTIEQTALNFNNNNDRIATVPRNPTIATDGSAVDHVINTDGSCDMSFEWVFDSTGNAGNIDGFIVYLFAGTSSSVYSFGTTPSQENVWYATTDKRAFVLQGVPSDKYYTWGIQSYRIVDTDISSTGVLKSSIIVSSASDEKPYLPSSSVAFSGLVTGTLQGSGGSSSSVSTVVDKANNALQLGSTYNKVTFDSNSGVTVYKYDSTAQLNKARVVLNATDGIKISTTSDGSQYTDKFYVDTNGIINGVGLNLDSGTTLNNISGSTLKSGLANGDSNNVIPNYNFLDWTGTLPNLYTSVVGTAPTKITSDNSFGNAMSFNVTGGANSYLNTNDITNLPFYQYIYVETTFKLTSGTIDGAGILFRYWDNTTPTAGVLYDNKLGLKSILTTSGINSPSLNVWYTVSKVFKVSTNATNSSFGKYNCYVMGGWSSFETVTAKTILFDNVSVRTATEQEINAYNTGSTVTTKSTNWDGAYTDTNNWKMTGKTTINGGKIEADTVTTSQLIVGDFTNFCPNPTFLAGVNTEWTSNVTVYDSTASSTPVPTVSPTKFVGATTARDSYCGAFIPVKGGDSFYVSIDGATSDSTYNLGIGVNAQKDDGTNTWQVIYRTHTSTWGTTSGTVTIPTGYTKARVFVQVENSSGTGTMGTWYFTNVVVRKRMTGDLMVDGSITFDKAQGGQLKIGEAYGNGFVQVFADTDGDGVQDVVGTIDSTGATFSSVYSNNYKGNVVTTSSAVQTYYVDCNNGKDSNSGLGSMTNAKRDLQVLLNSLPKFINSKGYTINVQGTYNGNITIEGFHGGYLTINGVSDATRLVINGSLFMWDNNAKIYLSYINIFPVSGSSYAVYCANNSNLIWFMNMKAYCGTSTASNSLHGWYIENSNIHIEQCHCYYNSDRGLYLEKNSRAILWDCKGNPPVGILCTDGSICQGGGTRWGGSIVRQGNSWIGYYNDGGTAWTNDVWQSVNGSGINYGETTPPAPPVVSAQKYSISVAPQTGDNWSTSGYWTNDEVKQGNWGYGDRYGLWYYDFSVVKGKVIDSATITVNNISAGNSGNKTIYIYSHRYTSRSSRPPSTAPAISGNYVSSTVANGGSYTIDITSFMQSNIANSIDTALGIYASGTANYMKVTTTPTISITYH